MHWRSLRILVPVAMSPLPSRRSRLRWSRATHGRDPDVARSVRIAIAAQLASLRLDADRATLYFDLIIHSLSEAARRALRTMDPAKYEYQSDFARHYFSKGKDNGEQAGRAALVIRQLAVRFGELSEAVRNKIATASVAELDAIGERLLTAKTVAEALGNFEAQSLVALTPRHR